MGKYLEVYLFDDYDHYKRHKREHQDCWRDYAPRGRMSGQQGLNLGLYNEWKGTTHNLETIFVGEVQRQFLEKTKKNFVLLKILAWILDECHEGTVYGYVVMENT